MGGYRQNNDEPLFSFEISLSEKFVEIKKPTSSSHNNDTQFDKITHYFYRGNCMASVMMCDTAQAGMTPVFTQAT